MAFFRNFPMTEFEYDGTGITRKVVDIFRYAKPIDDELDNIAAYKFYHIEPGERPDQVSQKIYGTPNYYWTFFLLNDHLRRGLECWPLGQQEFDDYMRLEYSGVVVNTQPVIVYNSDGDIEEYRNSVAERFQIGERVVGILSGAYGYLVEKDVQMQQLVLENVVGNFLEGELVRGDITLDEITTFEVFERQNAPKYYVDSTGREVDNSRFITGATYLNPDFEDIRTITHREYEENLNEGFREIRVIKPNLIKRFAERYEKLLKGVGT